MPFAERLQRVARLFSCNLCAGSITGKALDNSEVNLSSALVDLRSELELRESGLQQSNGLGVIPLKPQLSYFNEEGIVKRRLLGCSR